MAKSDMLIIGKDCKNSYFSFLITLVFQEGFNFCVFILGSSGEFDSHVSLPGFPSVCIIAPSIICFDLKFKTTFTKITTSLSCNYIPVFIILLQIFFLFNFLPLFCHL